MHRLCVRGRAQAEGKVWSGQHQVFPVKDRLRWKSDRNDRNTLSTSVRHISCGQKGASPVREPQSCFSRLCSFTSRYLPSQHGRRKEMKNVAAADCGKAACIPSPARLCRATSPTGRGLEQICPLPDKTKKDTSFDGSFMVDGKGLWRVAPVPWAQPCGTKPLKRRCTKTALRKMQGSRKMGSLHFFLPHIRFF